MRTEPKEKDCNETAYYAHPKRKRALYYIRWKWWVLIYQIAVLIVEYIKALRVVGKYFKTQIKHYREFHLFKRL